MCQYFLKKLYFSLYVYIRIGIYKIRKLIFTCYSMKQKIVSTTEFDRHPRLPLYEIRIKFSSPNRRIVARRATKQAISYSNTGGQTLDGWMAKLELARGPRVMRTQSVIHHRHTTFQPPFPPSPCPCHSSRVNNDAPVGAIMRSAHLKWKNHREISVWREVIFIYIYTRIHIRVQQQGGREGRESDPVRAKKSMNAFFHGRWPGGLIGEHRPIGDQWEPGIIGSRYTTQPPTKPF